MNCMKCGKETKLDQIFCAECLAEMEKYPVKPGTVVQIPMQPAKKQVHHRRITMSAEEQVKRLTMRVRGLVAALILMTVVAVVFALISFDILEKSHMHNLLGQNYSVAADDAEDAADLDRFVVTDGVD